MKNAALRLYEGFEPIILSKEITLTIADAITLLRLSEKDLELIARQLDPRERHAQPSSSLLRMQFIDQAAKAAIRRGYNELDSSDLAAFMKSPMRGDVPKLRRISRNGSKSPMRGDVPKLRRISRHGSKSPMRGDVPKLRRISRNGSKVKGSSVRSANKAQSSVHLEEENAWFAKRSASPGSSKRQIDGVERTEEGSSEAAAFLGHFAKLARRIHLGCELRSPRRHSSQFRSDFAKEGEVDKNS